MRGCSLEAESHSISSIYGGLDGAVAMGQVDDVIKSRI
jgi:hypothetical protein